MENNLNLPPSPLETTFKILACYDKFRKKIDVLKERGKNLVVSNIATMEQAKIEKVRAKIQQP